MVINQLNEFKKKKFWISTTGYRILIILRALIEGEKSLEELIDILQNDSFVNKAISKDTVRLTLNTLKSAGYKFSRPCKTNNFKYKLLYNPFALNISNEEIKALIILRERLSEELSWQDVLKINDLYEKFTSLSNNQEFKNKINTSQPLNNIDKSILIEISNPKLKGKKIQIKYLSPKHGIELLDVIPQKIVYENGKIYLLCYIFKYLSVSMLNIERIKSVVNINISEEHYFPEVYSVVYKLTGENIKSFNKTQNEEIIESSFDYLIIRTQITNEFTFIQRILQYGNNVKIISPDFFKEKLINKLKLIKKGYEA